MVCHFSAADAIRFAVATEQHNLVALEIGQFVLGDRIPSRRTALEFTRNVRLAA